MRKNSSTEEAYEKATQQEAPDFQATYSDKNSIQNRCKHDHQVLTGFQLRWIPDQPTGFQEL